MVILYHLLRREIEAQNQGLYFMEIDRRQQEKALVINVFLSYF